MLFITLALSALPGCSSPRARDMVVARVGDAELVESELSSRLTPGMDTGEQTKERTQLVEEWVRQELLYQAALERGLDQQARLKMLLDQTRRDLLIAALLDTEFENEELIFDESEIRRYYDAHPDQFQRLQTEIRACHILFASQRDAKIRRQALLRGESFAEVAREHSLDPDTRYKGGDLGYFTEFDEPLLWAACRALPPNRISNPLRTEYGYHLIQVLERWEAGTIRDLELVRGEIIERLVREHHQNKLDQLVATLKTSADWAITAPNSP